MSIPESQLEVWIHPGASIKAKATHESVRTALTRHLTVPGSYEVFLQGSYKNDTNIRGDSDVDIVVQYNGAWHRDLSALPAAESDLYKRTYPTADYRWHAFRGDVLRALQQYYGSSTVDDSHGKALKLASSSGRLAADVVPAFAFRAYTHFRGPSPNQHGFHEGIHLFHANGSAIINYPKLHYENGVVKNQATNGRFKQVVRMFKNARTYLIDRGDLPPGSAPSYFVENLIYNVPNDRFGGSLQDAYLAVHGFFRTTDMATFPCQHCRHPLFGDQREQWSHDQAVTLLNALAALWNDWHE